MPRGSDPKIEDFAKEVARPAIDERMKARKWNALAQIWVS